MTLKIFRYDKQRGLRYVDYKIPHERNLTALKALFYIAENYDDHPAFRSYFCNKGKCGSCLMTINGKTRRACCTNVEENMVVEPLYDYPIQRDLVVDFGMKTSACPEYYLIRNGSIVLESKLRAQPRKAAESPRIYAHIDPKKCTHDLDGCEKCVKLCPVNKMEDLETVTGQKVEPESAIIRVVDKKAEFAGVCVMCAHTPCLFKCPTGALFRDRKTGILRIDRKLCIGCGLCAAACPVNAIFLNRQKGYAVKCEICGVCLKVCPTQAIKMKLWKH